MLLLLYLYSGKGFQQEAAPMTGLLLFQEHNLGDPAAAVFFYSAPED